MNKAYVGAAALLTTWGLSSWGAPKNDDDTVTLYQIGKDGNYCLSITPNESGCISGSTDDGGTINVLNFLKGKQVVFKNLSDAPHDMRFSGANSEDLPPQDPNGAAAVKKLGAEDPNKEKITCSFHGPQLSVGYSVLDAKNVQQVTGDPQGHEDPLGGPKPPRGGPNPQMVTGNGPSGLGNIKTTGLADVSKEVLKKGRPADVAKLVTARPDLMPQLEEVRPLLAKEIAKGKPGNPIAQNKNGLDIDGGPTNVATVKPPSGPGAPLLAAAQAPKTGGFTGNPFEMATVTAIEDKVSVKDVPYLDAEGEQGKKALAAKGASAAAGTKAAARAIAGTPGASAADTAGDRTRLKVVRKEEERRNPWLSGHTILIALLLMAVFILGRSAIALARSKKKRKPQPSVAEASRQTGPATARAVGAAAVAATAAAAAASEHKSRRAAG